jgi:hypothetical protein
VETKEGFKARQPDYKGRLDVAAWVNKDKNGKQYIAVKIANNVNLFKNEPKPKQAQPAGL